MPRTTTWMPDGWHHPARLDLPTGHHLRPIRAADLDLDLCAVLGSQERLWSVLGAARGWPPTALTVDEDRRDLARYEAANRRRESFTYALLDVGETELLGRLHVEPPRKVGADGDVWWWVADQLVGGPVDAALADVVPQWVTRRWPLARPRFVGRDLTWADWSALPDVRPPAGRVLGPTDECAGTVRTLSVEPRAAADARWTGHRTGDADPADTGRHEPAARQEWRA